MIPSSKNHDRPLRFESGRDTLLVGILWGTALILCAALVIIIFDDGWTYGLVWSPFLLGLAVLCVWVERSTYYELTPELLTIHAGPFRCRVTLSSITEARAERSILSSPALSRDRLRISRHGAMEIYISPANKDEFVRVLKQFNPEVKTEVNRKEN